MSSDKYDTGGRAKNGGDVPGSDTAVLKSFYSPFVLFVYKYKMNLGTNELIAEYRAKNGIEKNVADTTITTAPNFVVLKEQLRKKIQTECDELQKQHDKLMSLSSLEEKLKAREALLANRGLEHDKKVDALYAQQVSLNAKEAEYDARLRALLDEAQQQAENNAAFQSASQQLAAQLAELLKLRDEDLPALQCEVDKNIHKAYETVAELLNHVRSYRGIVSAAVGSPTDSALQEIVAAEKTLENILSELKPEDADPGAPPEGNA